MTKVPASYNIASLANDFFIDSLMAEVVIGADICPIGANLSHFERGDAQTLFNDLLPELQSADLAIANLECPFIDHPSPIRKTGPNFGVSAAAINGIRNGGIGILTLGNNHIMDHGPAGLETTLQTCADAEIDTVGAGGNLAIARRILIKQIGSLRLGILAVAEHEFSIATDHSPGANPLDPIDFVRNVRENRERFDYLIVLVHGSHEFHVPTPRVQDTCRFIIEMGANAVIVQHPHCLGGYEEYRGCHIVYGQGALLMDEEIYRHLKSFHEGFLVKLSIANDLTSRLDVIPFTQSDPGPGARRMPPERGREFRRALAKRSEAIKDPAFVKEEWIRFCDGRKHGYLSALLGHTRILRKLNKRGHITRLLRGSRAMLGVRNIVNCETHREAVQTIFNEGLL